MYHSDCQEEHSREHSADSDFNEAPAGTKTLPSAQGPSALFKGNHAGNIEIQVHYSVYPYMYIAHGRSANSYNFIHCIYIFCTICK